MVPVKHSPQAMWTWLSLSTELDGVFCLTVSVPTTLLDVDMHVWWGHDSRARSFGIVSLTNITAWRGQEEVGCRTILAISHSLSFGLACEMTMLDFFCNFVFNYKIPCM